MKFLLVLMMTGLPFGLNAGELDSISLITPMSYSKVGGAGQTFQSGLTTGFASLFKVNIEKRVSAKFAPYRNDLAKYFPKPGELDSFVKAVVQNGIKTQINTGSGDQAYINFYGYLGRNLIGKIADRILENEGIEDAPRRALWTAKMLAPFNSCIANSKNSQYDANHCVDALTTSLIPSMGIGLVYEMSKSSLNPSIPVNEQMAFDLNQVVLYKRCILNYPKGSADDVTRCALVAMKSGVLKIADTALTKSIKEKVPSPAKAAAIKKEVWQKFEVCTIQVGHPKNSGKYRDQFTDCTDDLMKTAGSLIVQDTILSTPTVISLFGTTDSKKLAVDKGEAFRKCADAQAKKGTRVNGTLDISPCERAITNDVTYKVVTETFKNTARKTIKSDNAKSLKISNEGAALLNSCWNNQQSEAAREGCLKKTIVNFSQALTSARLNEAIPVTMPGRTEMVKSSVSVLGTCIEKALPTSITKSDDLDSRVGSCTAKLIKSVALKVADFQIRETAKGNLSAEQTELLVKTLVEGEFSACIGASPDDDGLDKCTDALTIKAAKNITEISFAKEVKAYLASNGGLKGLGIIQANIDDFLGNLNRSTKECFEKKTSAKTIDRVNSCVKNSIKKIAFFFGDLKFDKSVGSLYLNRDADKKIVENQFKKSLSDCLAKKDGKEFSINDFTQNLYVCSNDVSANTTIKVGEDQISTSLNLYLKDRPGMKLGVKRDELKKTLIGNFKTCITTSKDQDACIDNLKREATKSIVITYGRIETKAQLETDVTPPQLKPVENEFLTCIAIPLKGDALQTHIDECTKNFTLGFAKELGALKLNTLLKTTLGTVDFNAQKKAIDTALAEYNTCLSGLKVYKISDGLTDKLSVCTDKLTNSGMNIVRSSLNTWMTSDDKDAATIKIKKDFANFLPCLSALLPSSPYTPQLQGNIDSALKPMAIMIAQYIEYDPENAKQTLTAIMSKLNVDLTDVTQSKKAKAELLDYLYKSGALDQFIKGIVRGTVKDTFGTLSEKDIPKSIRDALLKKENFEEIFSTSEGLLIKDMVMEKILRPVLLQNADMKSAPLVASMTSIKDNVIKLLINAPSFGDKAIKLSVQNQINHMGGITKIMAKILYGGKSLDWERVRLSEQGKAAEAFIKANILTPQFTGVVQAADEKVRIAKEAEQLVTKAVKSFSSDKK